MLSSLALLLVAANGVLFLGNRSRQAEVTQRQNFIEQSVQLSQLNDSLIRALAKQAVDGKDSKLLDLLAQYGVGVPPAAPAAATPAAAPPSAAPASPLPSARK